MAVFRQARLRSKTQIVKGVAYTARLEVYASGALTLADSGTWTLYDSAGSTVATGSTSADGLVHTASIASGDTSAETVGTRWMLVWALTYGSETWTVRSGVSLVTADLQCPVSPACLQAHLPELADGAMTPRGQTSWEPQIEDAWHAVLRMLDRARLPPQQILYPDEVYSVALYEALVHVGRVLDGGSGRYSVRLGEWTAARDAAWAALVVDVDTDEDGAPDTSGDGLRRLDVDASPTGGAAISSGRGW